MFCLCNYSANKTNRFAFLAHIDEDSNESSIEQIVTLISPQVEESSGKINSDAASIPVSRTGEYRVLTETHTG